MKLSSEATQAIKTTVEQLRLLLVDYAIETIREQVASSELSHHPSSRKNKYVGLYVPLLVLEADS